MYWVARQLEKALRPARFDVTPNTPSSSKDFTHWFKTFEYFLEVLPPDNLDKLRVLTNFVSPSFYELFSECIAYKSAIELLKGIYVIPTNEVFARHLLATRRQQTGESIDQYLLALQFLSKDCNFGAVDAKTHKEQAIRDSLITGLTSNSILQRLLDATQDLQPTFEQAHSLDIAQRNSDAYDNFPPMNTINSGIVNTVADSGNETSSSNAVVASHFSI